MNAFEWEKQEADLHEVELWRDRHARFCEPSTEEIEAELARREIVYAEFGGCRHWSHALGCAWPHDCAAAREKTEGAKPVVQAAAGVSDSAA